MFKPAEAAPLEQIVSLPTDATATSNNNGRAKKKRANLDRAPQPLPSFRCGPGATKSSPEGHQSVKTKSKLEFGMRMIGLVIGQIVSTYPGQVGEIHTPNLLPPSHGFVGTDRQTRIERQEGRTEQDIFPACCWSAMKTVGRSGRVGCSALEGRSDSDSTSKARKQGRKEGRRHLDAETTLYCGGQRLR